MEKNNSSTYATWTMILVMIIEVILKYCGITIEHQTVVMLATGIVTFIIAVYSRMHPNDIDWLGNGKPTIKVKLNDEQMEEIHEAIDEAKDSVTKEYDELILNDEYVSDEDDQ